MARSCADSRVKPELSVLGWLYDWRVNASDTCDDCDPGQRDYYLVRVPILRETAGCFCVAVCVCVHEEADNGRCEGASIGLPYALSRWETLSVVDRRALARKGSAYVRGSRRYLYTLDGLAQICWDDAGVEVEEDLRSLGHTEQDCSVLATFATTPKPAWLSWHDGLIVRMAAEALASRRFDDLPIIADGLEDAGCNDPAILRHLRTHDHPHSWNCWALRWLTGDLGRERQQIRERKAGFISSMRH